MRAIRNRILAAIGTGGLAVNGIAGCGGESRVGTTSDANAEAPPSGMVAADSAVSGNANGADSDARVDVVGITDGVAATDRAVNLGDATAMGDSAAAGVGDGSEVCTCSMEFGPCGDANPCGCCVGGLICGGGTCHLTVRRPFLVGASLRFAKSVRRGDWARSFPPPSVALDERTADALHRAWLYDALQEHASVAAFARFTLQLLAVGAPPELIALSQRASLDEVAHARACFGLAWRYGGRSGGPSSLDVHDALGRPSLVSLAELTAAEGCAGETLGAAVAAEQLTVAQDQEVVSILRKIASDELRHAELAWRFARWAVQQGGEAVWLAIEHAVRGAIAETRGIPMRDYGVDDAAWNAHGRLTCIQAHRAHERAITQVVEPCLAALASIAIRPRRSWPAPLASKARDAV